MDSKLSQFVSEYWALLSVLLNLFLNVFNDIFHFGLLFLKHGRFEEFINSEVRIFFNQAMACIIFLLILFITMSVEQNPVDHQNHSVTQHKEQER